MNESYCVKIIKLVACNDRGIRIGENHHNATLSDHEVELIRQLYEEHGLSMAELSRKFEVTRRTIRLIVSYRSRGQTPMSFKLMTVMAKQGGAA